MSTAVPLRSAARGDSMLAGVALMLVLNVVQRGVGFVRGILFCRFLADDALGQYSLANGFLMLAAPLVVLGLPGSFGRYVEYYRQRGQLRAYLRRMSAVTLALTGIGVLSLSVLSPQLSAAVLGDPSALRLMTYTLGTLAIVVAFNYVNELLTAIRQVRAVSWMQFVNSLAFTAVGLLLVITWESSAEAIVLAYAISCIAAVIAIAPWFGEIAAEFSADTERLDARDLWTKLLPFAGWVWLTNLLANISDFIDRFMIIQWSGLDFHAAQSLVGQYHSSRVVPTLFVSLAMTIAAIVLPYLSHAWEAGRTKDVSDKINLSTKLVTMSFTGCGLAVLWLSPILFGWILGGKYDNGLAALPWALVSCIWFAFFAVAQNYLWCAERAKLGTAALAVGVVVNAGLNLFAIPYGLTAIMAARGIASLAPALVVLWFSQRHGMRISRGLWLTSLAPLVLLAGPIGGSILFVAMLVLDWRTHWLFDEEEEPQLRDAWKKVVSKLGLA